MKTKSILQHSSFFRFCEIVQEIAESRGSTKKSHLFADYLNSLNDPIDAALACRFIGEGAFSTVSGKKASIGHRTIAVCAAHFCDIDYDHVFKPCRTATGSASETIEKLMANLPFALEKRNPEWLSLSQIEKAYIKLEQMSKRADKENYLYELWGMMTPIEIKYFIRIMGQGSLRIGFESKSILNALAIAYNIDVEEIRYANMITGSLERATLLALENRLDEARFRLFHPLSFMLASPAEPENIEHIQDYVAEEKFDGMRCQLHADDSQIALFSRDLNDISDAFPDICKEFQSKSLPPIVLDGEICVFSQNTIMPFQHLQKRMGVKKPTSKLLTDYPVVFIAYDVLFFQNQTTFDKPLFERSARLTEICTNSGIKMSRQMEVHSSDQVNQLFDDALLNGNEGLMLKKKDSIYEYGQRRKTWLKIKKPGGSIDTVIMYAHAGSGKRGGTYSDFTLGVSVENNPDYAETFIPIGKAYGGYTDDELKKLNKAMKPLIVERFGPTLSLKPGIVVELEFDDIQVNKRTKAGYTLRLPRFKAIRWDLSPKDADTLEEVERLFNERQNRQRRNQSAGKSLIDFDASN